MIQIFMQGGEVMVQQTRTKLSRVLLVALLGVSFSVLSNNNGWATAPVDKEITKAIEQLRDGDPENDDAAISILKQKGKAAVDPLIEAVKSETQDEGKWAIVRAIGEMGPDAKEAIEELKKLLKEDKYNSSDDLTIAVESLTKIAPADFDTVQTLINVFDHQNQAVRETAALSCGDVLKTINFSDKNKAINFVKAKLSPDNRWQVQLGAALALGSSGQEVTDVFSTVEKLLQLEKQEVISNTINALKLIEDRLRLQAPNLNSKEKSNARDGLKKAIAALDKLKNFPNLETDIQDVKQRLKQAIKELSGDWSIHPFAIYFALCLSISLILLWLRPLWVLTINNALSFVDIELPSVKGIKIKIPPRNALIIGFFHYHDRVLDAWVAAQIDTARREFNKKETVQERQIYIPLPVILEGKTVSDLTPQNLQPKFAEKRWCLLIWGEGGSGKTSLACQLAHWAMSDDPKQRFCKHQMLPILLEQELDITEGKKAFTEAIRGLLSDLIDAPESISEEFLEKLLRNRRLLVIVDRFSEMSEAIQKQIRPEDPKFCVNALVVTSRMKESLGGINKTTIEPMRVDGNRFLDFIGSYLTKRGKRDLFNDQEIINDRDQILAIAGQQEITVLLVKLYTEQMIATKTGEITGNLPDNIPELMLHYLNQLNRKIPENYLENRTVHQNAKIVAWECLKQTYRPTTAKYDAVLNALAGDDAKIHLQYLENRLHIIQTISPAYDKIRFVLDPLAEYLAGLYLVESCGNDEQRWNDDFLAKIDAKPDEIANIKGFLRALYNCCLTKNQEIKIPENVLEKLKKWTD